MQKHLEHMAQVDNALMRSLKVSELGHKLASTDRGELLLKLPFKGEWRDYRFYLDAVPVDDVQNKSLLKLYYGEQAN